MLRKPCMRHGHYHDGTAMQDHACTRSGQDTLQVNCRRGCLQCAWRTNKINLKELAVADLRRFSVSRDSRRLGLIRQLF